MGNYKTDGAAMVYPDPLRGGEASILNQSPHEEQAGLTKREYFAAMAMQGLCASGFFTDVKLQKQADELGANMSEVIAESAVDIADELIKSLNTNP